MDFKYSDNYVKQRGNDRPRRRPTIAARTTETIKLPDEDHHHDHSNHKAHKVILPADTKKEYRKLYAVLGLVVFCATAMSLVLGFDWQEWMRWFMAGFFVIFGSFKLIGYEGFVAGFPTYDLLGKRFKLYTYTYPFIELFLGFLFAADLLPVFRNIVTLIIMLVGAYSITKAMASNRDIACVCLGDVIKLPLSTISLVEDGLMAAMAAIMLIAHFIG